jgi:hypothetical protein
MMHPRGEASPRTKAYRLRDSEIGLPHVFSVGAPGGGTAQRAPDGAATWIAVAAAVAIAAAAVFAWYPRQCRVSAHCSCWSARASATFSSPPEISTTASSPPASHRARAGTLSLAVGIIGATVMPHVVYLHSALQKNRIQATGRKERRRLLTGNKWDCIAGLGVAGLVNLAMLCVAAALFHKPAECRLPSAWRSQSGGSCMTPGSAPPRLPGRHHRAPVGS